MENIRLETRHLPPDVQELLDTIIDSILALASRMNSNSDSNSLGGILIYPLAGAAPKIEPKGK